MINILFVCSGNICRSPMAEGLLKKFLVEQNLDSQVTVSSAGTLGIIGNSASENGIIACHKEYDIDISWHESQGINDELLEQSDIILCMSQDHSEYINNYFPDYSYKSHILKQFAGLKDSSMDIADPVGMDLNEYNKICHELAGLIRQSMGKIKETVLIKSKNDIE
jgi:protein-tyrosine-phosphatase